MTRLQQLKKEINTINTKLTPYLAAIGHLEMASLRGQVFSNPVAFKQLIALLTEAKDKCFTVGSVKNIIERDINASFNEAFHGSDSPRVTRIRATVEEMVDLLKQKGRHVEELIDLKDALSFEETASQEKNNVVKGPRKRRVSFFVEGTANTLQDESKLRC